ncbi:hypothetical protein F5051DRAFT_441198 [Lentinula edodes]|nr:hypothetical protein F5051DRAFT_441198 [Lentinula edodes]
MLLRFYRSCSLCLLFIGILLGTTSVIGSPITDISHLERRMITYDVRIGHYRTPKAPGKKVRGWVRKSESNEEDIKCICVGTQNANCYGLLKDFNVLHVTHLKMRDSRSSKSRSSTSRSSKSQSSMSQSSTSQSSTPKQHMPDASYFIVEKDISVNWDALENWTHQEFTGTVWDFLENIVDVNQAIEDKLGFAFPVDNQDSFIDLIKAYLKLEGIIDNKVREIDGNAST